MLDLRDELPAPREDAAHKQAAWPPPPVTAESEPTEAQHHRPDMLGMAVQALLALQSIIILLYTVAYDGWLLILTYHPVPIKPPERVIDTAGMGDLIIAVLSAALFLAWFYRAYRDIPSSAGDKRIAAGWAVAGFFIPVWNLVAPCLSMLRIVTSLGNNVGSTQRRHRALVIAWWASALLYIALVCGPDLMDPHGIESYGGSLVETLGFTLWYRLILWTEIANGIAFTVSSICLITLVRLVEMNHYRANSTG